MTEKELTKEMKKYWKNNGWLAIRNQQNIGSHKGLADFTVIKNFKSHYWKLKLTVQALASNGDLL